MKKHIIISVLLFMLCFIVYGQISTDEDPISFRRDISVLKISEKSQKIMPSFDLKKYNIIHEI